MKKGRSFRVIVERRNDWVTGQFSFNLLGPNRLEDIEEKKRFLVATSEKRGDIETLDLSLLILVMGKRVGWLLIHAEARQMRRRMESGRHYG